MQVREIMTADPAVSTADASIADAARLMSERDCGQIPVVDNLEARKPIGVITDRDIACRAVAKDKGPDTPISEIMSQDIVTIAEDANAMEVLDKMERHQFRRIPVADAQGRITGIVSQADLVLRTDHHETAQVVTGISQPTA